MKLDEIRTKPEQDLLYRKGRTKKYPRFKKLVEKYNESGEPLSLEDATKYMGLSHHTLRSYAKEIGLKMTILTDEEGGKWIAFKKKK